MRIKLLLAALCGVALLFGSAAARQNTRPADISASAAPAAATPNTDKKPDASPAGEVEDLKRRVAELEEQNRALTRTPAEINAKLSASSGASSGGGSAAAPAPNASAAASSSTPANAPRKTDDPYVRRSEILGEGNKVKLYGFLRLDLDFDSQCPNNGQITFFITTPDARAGGSTNGDFSMHPRPALAHRLQGLPARRQQPREHLPPIHF